MALVFEAMSAPGLHGPDTDGLTRLVGDWIVAYAPALAQQVTAFRQAHGEVRRYSVAGLERLDTAGASLLLDLVGGKDRLDTLIDLPARHARLLAIVAEADAQPLASSRTGGVVEYIAEIGEAVADIWTNILRLIGFMGLLIVRLPGILFSPARWRVTPWVVQIQQTGLNAVPIIALLNFLVGAVVAFLGATILRDFGATLFTVDLIAFSFLREFGVLLSAIMVAGRSGSAFTAQLGSMKAHEEIDAIRSLGMSPIEVLVIPRALALMVTLPLLTVLAMLSGILGGALVCAMTLDISPTMYFSRIHEVLEMRHFWVGMSKAPIFAVIIALIGCLEGFKVTGSAESVGRHTTSSVVQSIFVVILIDAVAAVLFMEMGW